MSNQANFRQNKQQTQQLTSLSSSISTANTLQITTNTKLDSLIASSGVLPTALTGSGNLKVSIQELGNEGSERLNVEIGDVAQFPTALTGAGNLKVSIQEEFNSGMATSANQTAQTAHLNTIATALPVALTGSGNLKVCIQELGNEGSERLNTEANIAKLPTALTGSGNLKVSIQEESSSGLATSGNQASAIAHLNTLATASSAQATASNQTAQTAHLNTLATASSAQATSTLQSELSGKLTTINSNTTKSRVVSRLTSVPAISANSGGTSYDLGADFGTYATLKISADVGTSQPQDLYIQISADGVNWNWKTGVGFVSANGGGFMGFFMNTTIDQPLRYWRIFNNGGGMASPVLDTLMSIVSVE